jgi:Domain of unknown function (DUF4112)
MTARTSQAEILPPGSARRARDGARPRLGGGGGAFRDENLDLLSRLLDTWFRIPGTNIRFGLDGIVGFIPGIGDVLGGLASCIIVLAAYFRGVPLITIARMVANLAIEVVVGLVPVLGNLFDIGWRANRRNYHLLEGSLAATRRDTSRDWIFMGLLGLGLLTLAMLPFLLLLWLGGSLLHSLRAPGWR